MANPMSVSDGNFTVALQNGPWRYRFPFYDKGDSVSFIAIRKMRQSAAQFAQPASMASFSTPLGIGYLVQMSDPADVDCGLLEWEEQYAAIPKTRLEFGSATYTQTVDYAGDEALQFSGSFDAVVVYEYEKLTDTGATIPKFTQTPNAGSIPYFEIPNMPTLTAPKVIQLGAGILYITALTAAEIIAQGVPILADDTTTEIWMGRIVCRKSVYVKKKTLTLP